jgi:hypothetical protein
MVGWATAAENGLVAAPGDCNCRLGTVHSGIRHTHPRGNNKELDSLISGEKFSVIRKY